VAERRRLVLTSHTFLPIVGGAELGLHELAKRLGRRHEVIVLAPGDADPVTDYAPDGYRVIRVTRPARRAARKRMAARLAEFTGWAYARALIGLHRTGPPVDALGCHFLKRNGLITVLGRLLGIRVVVSLVGR
jgi:glycosyltransferase involved in cell wall biosynthesis